MMTFQKSNVVKRIIALIFALSPFLQHYNFPVIGKNIEYLLILFLGGSYALFAILTRNPYKREEKFIGTPIMIIMGLYCIIHHFMGTSLIYKPGTTNIRNIISFFSVLTICVVIFKDAQIREYYYRFTELIAVLMAFVVGIQVVIYYVFGNPISIDRSFLFPFQDLFTEGVKYSLSMSEMVIGGLFRPSAFFLEPAHYSQFCTIGLVSSLVRKKTLFNVHAVIISIGIVLTTSGIGILTTGMIWCAFIYINCDKLTRKKMLRILIGTMAFLIITIGLFYLSGSFRSAISRIFKGTEGHNSAIMGRLQNAEFIGKLNGRELLWGTGYKNMPTYGPLEVQYYMTGIVELIYCQGIIGTSLFLMCYLQMIIKSYISKSILPLYILFAYVPYLLGSSNLVMMTLIQYIPFLYISINRRADYSYTAP